MSFRKAHACMFAGLLLPLAAGGVFAAPTSLHFASQPWVVEAEDAASTQVKVIDGVLQLTASKGLTVWLDHALTPPYEITYRRRVVVSPNPAWRVSDMNQFWAAQLAAQGDRRRFHRSGAFGSYNDLPMYYAGIGGNTNTTTRFRRYDGHGRPLLAEYLDVPHLLRGDHTYCVQLIVEKDSTTLYLDGNKLFSSRMVAGGAGYFGLRLTGSSQVVSDFHVHKLP